MNRRIEETRGSKGDHEQSESLAHTDEIGCVLEADIYRPDFDFTGVGRLKHRPDEELLLRALVQTFLNRSLCIAEETPHGRHLVFPSQYRREKDIPHEPDIFVSYTFNGEWQKCAANANGVPSISPGLRGTSYPGNQNQNGTTLKGLNPSSVQYWRIQPLQGCSCFLSKPRVTRGA